MFTFGLRTCGKPNLTWLFAVAQVVGNQVCVRLSCCGHMRWTKCGVVVLKHAQMQFPAEHWNK